MDTRKKYGLSGAIIIVSCFLLLAGACEDSDRIEMETQIKNVLLDFNASTTNTVTAGTRSPDMVGGFGGNSYKFGLSVTKNGNATIPGSDDMTAIMSRLNADSPWIWEFRDNLNNPLIPRGPSGKPLKIKAYYYDAPSPGSGQIVATAFTNGIPFDFTQTNNPKQKEILYNTNTSYTIPSTGADKVVIPLQFQHAYSWISIRVTKYVDKGDFKLSGVSIDNLLGDWIKNKGKIDVETGLAMQGATVGPIGETRSPETLPVNPDFAITYDFLVPSFMDAGVKDEDIAITLMINGHKEVFPLDRAYLNQDGDKYGFRQGYYNTYNLEFNNSSLNMRLINWTSTTINGNFGAAPSVPTNYSRIDLRNGYYWGSLNKGTLLNAGTHLYDNYLTTVSYGGNGEYVPARPKPVTQGDAIYDDDENVATKEGVYPFFEMTTQDVSVEPVPWEDENGQLVAKEICRKYNGGGNRDWRLPRASELRTLFLCFVFNAGRQEILNLNFTESSGNREKLYWTGTEVNENDAWAVFYYNQDDLKHRGPMISTQDKRMKLSVRCIRDVR
ncbi:fimbrillin family protein [Bacteroides fragilis]|uniref:Lcl C-terminal domain-containing protein n=1 Tax=Bacteroides fragilis str. 2-F-2 \|nr:fimbrillin family protein [Bacteroides fragilis]EXY16977.1 hypothetical protein M077_3632 [Bacteroides fragilis str. 2-F-2 \